MFGKIVPGTAILISLSLFFNYPSKYDILDQLSFWTWLTSIGFSWIIGFAIQSIGEFFLGKLSWGYRYYPKWIIKDGKKELLTLEKWLDIYFVQFQKEGVFKENELRQDERIVVIKEACGNGFIATFIILLLHWFHLGSVSFDALSLILFILFLALWRMHLKHVHLQFKALQTFLKSRELK